MFFIIRSAEENQENYKDNTIEVIGIGCYYSKVDFNFKILRILIGNFYDENQKEAGFRITAVAANQVATGILGLIQKNSYRFGTSIA